MTNERENLVVSDLANGVAHVQLNRPEALNAFSPAVLEALVASIRAADDNPDTRVIVLSGAGRAFSAGVDLKALQGIDPEAGRIGDVFDGVAADEISGEQMIASLDAGARSGTAVSADSARQAAVTAA